MDSKKEMKERFVQMLKDKQIIIVEGLRTARNGDGDYKFIGANNEGSWDFTKSLGDWGLIPVRSEEWKESAENPTHTFIRTNDPYSVIHSALLELAVNGIFNENIMGGSDLYKYIREKTSIFYF